MNKTILGIYPCPFFLNNAYHRGSNWWTEPHPPNKGLTNEIGDFAVPEFRWLDQSMKTSSDPIPRLWQTRAFLGTQKWTYSGRVTKSFAKCLYCLCQWDSIFIAHLGKIMTTYHWFFRVLFPPKRTSAKIFFPTSNEIHDPWDSAELSRTLWKTRDPAWGRWLTDSEADSRVGIQTRCPNVSSIYLV